MKSPHSVLLFILLLIHQRLTVSGVVLGDGNSKVKGPQGAGSHTLRVRCEELPWDRAELLGGHRGST